MLESQHWHWCLLEPCTPATAKLQLICRVTASDMQEDPVLSLPIGSEELCEQLIRVRYPGDTRDPGSSLSECSLGKHGSTG